MVVLNYLFYSSFTKCNIEKCFQQNMYVVELAILVSHSKLYTNILSLPNSVRQQLILFKYSVATQLGQQLIIIQILYCYPTRSTIFCCYPTRSTTLLLPTSPGTVNSLNTICLSKVYPKTRQIGGFYSQLVTS